MTTIQLLVINHLFVTMIPPLFIIFMLLLKLPFS